MAVTSSVQIMNSALIKLGAERIASEDESNLRAKLCKEQYPKRRDMLLRAHPWKFAVRRSELAAVDPKPDDFGDWGYVFQLPTDVCRILQLVDICAETPWDTENQYLLIDESEVTIRYISRITDVTKFDDNFIEALAWDLAADIAFALTQKQDLADSCVKRAEKELALARSFNAQQGSVQRVQAEDFLNARRY
jgi:hypothetical protein